MSKVDNSPSLGSEIKAFIENNKVLCGCTLGLAIVGYAAVKAFGHFISWIKEARGVAKKAHDVANPIFQTNQGTNSKTSQSLNKNRVAGAPSPMSQQRQPNTTQPSGVVAAQNSILQPAQYKVAQAVSDTPLLNVPSQLPPPLAANPSPLTPLGYAIAGFDVEPPPPPPDPKLVEIEQWIINRPSQYPINVSSFMHGLSQCQNGAERAAFIDRSALVGLSKWYIKNELIQKNLMSVSDANAWKEPKNIAASSHQQPQPMHIMTQVPPPRAAVQNPQSAQDEIISGPIDLQYLNVPSMEPPPINNENAKSKISERDLSTVMAWIDNWFKASNKIYSIQLHNEIYNGLKDSLDRNQRVSFIDTLNFNLTLELDSKEQVDQFKTDLKNELVRFGY